MGIGTFQKSATELELVTIFEDRLEVVAPAILADRTAAGRPLDRSRGQDLIALTGGGAFRAIIDATLTHLGVTVKAAQFEVGDTGGLRSRWSRPGWASGCCRIAPRR